jgi:hypothetical protein
MQELDREEQRSLIRPASARRAASGSASRPTPRRRPDVPLARPRLTATLAVVANSNPKRLSRRGRKPALTEAQKRALPRMVREVVRAVPAELLSAKVGA